MPSQGGNTSSILVGSTINYQIRNSRIIALFFSAPSRLAMIWNPPLQAQFHLSPHVAQPDRTNGIFRMAIDLDISY